jgi:hypothetical protein
MGERHDAVALHSQLLEILQLRQIAEGDDGAVLQEQATHLGHVVERVTNASAIQSVTSKHKRRRLGARTSLSQEAC